MENKVYHLTAKWSEAHCCVDETEKPDVYFLNLYNEQGQAVHALCRIQQTVDEDEEGNPEYSAWYEIDIEAGCSNTEEGWETLEDAIAAMEQKYLMP